MTRAQEIEDGVRAREGTVDRRALIAGSAALAAVAGGGLAKVAPRLGPPVPFDFTRLTALARTRARAPFEPPEPPEPGLEAIDFDAFQALRYDPSMTLLGGPGQAAVRLFPQGRSFPYPVRIHLVRGTRAQEVLFDPALFQAPPGHPIRSLKRASFAGFRVMNARGEGDWLAYLGASYFRSAGPGDQYGASARGLAINSGGPGPEEFPAFTSFWLEPAPDAGIVVHALLEGPSVVGAFRFQTEKRSDAVVQAVVARLFFRKAVPNLGLAPLTSMFWYGQDTPPPVRDWRPQIHDSDGLVLRTGRGERIFRPLQDPPRVITNAYADAGPRAYALVQRDRVFDHYQDDGAFYEKRPDVWIEPGAGFGSGAVRLVELPTVRETDDNIVAFWTPSAGVAAGSALEASYKILWTLRDPDPGTLARVLATRTGLGGLPGQPPRTGWRRVAVDFAGPALEGRDRLTGVRGEVGSPSGARIENISAYGLVGSSVFRLLFDVEVQAGRPTDLRAVLTAEGRNLSETWIYQLFPESRT